MNSPLVSVIIPNYNHAKFLDERIQSVLNQTYHNFEVIILDDCSSDNSRSVVERYRSNPHVSHIVFNEKNSGSPFLQWKKAFGLTKGSIIWIAESDDFCKEIFLETMLKCFDEQKCVMAFCKSMMVDVDGNELGTLKIQDMNSSFLETGTCFIRKYLRQYNIVVNASSALFRKDALKNINDEFTKYSGCGDWIFWAEISNSGDVEYVDEILNYYRQHDQGTTIQSVKSGRGEIETYKVITYLREYGYITSVDFFRTKLGKLSHFTYRTELSKDVVEKIYTYWKFNLFEKIIVSLHHFFRKNKK